MKKMIMFLAAIGLIACVCEGLADTTDGRPMRVVISFDDGIAEHLTIAAPELEKRGWRGVFNIVTDWIGRPGKLTWEDVAELVKRGHEVATHTKTHPHLAKMLKDGKADEVRAEYALSAAEIERRTGRKPRYMCYPFTDRNEETDRLCREAGLVPMTVQRWNFGEGDENGEVSNVLRKVIDGGARRFDILHHGITKNGGGWRPFADRESFIRHLDAIKAAEKRGEIVVTNYAGLLSEKQAPRRYAENLEIGGVRGIEGDYTVRLIRHYDPKADATIFDAEIAGQRTIICRRRGRYGVD